MFPVIEDPRTSAAYWAGIEKDFERVTPGVRLTVRLLPWAGWDRTITEGLESDNGPDAILLVPDQIPRFASRGMLAPVDAVLRDVGHLFQPSAMTAVTRDGAIFAAPIYQTVTTTIYNKRLLAEAGVSMPPTSWDEIKAAAPKLRRRGVAVLDYSASDHASLNLNFYPLLWQAGGRVFTEGGDQVAFNSPEGLEALSFLVGLYRQGAVPATALENDNILAGQALGGQRAAMGYSVVMADADLAARTWGRENVLVGGPLKGPAREVAFGAPGALGIRAKSRHRAAAEKFLAFMIRPEQLRSLGRVSGYLSPRIDITVPSASPYSMQYQAAQSSTFAGEPHPASRRVMALLAPEIRAALTGRKSPAQALDAAAEAADTLLRSA
jgi:multiple sugar transport system substrate-binding protein